MITRQQAVSVIYEVVNSGILSDELEGNLQDVANCIEDEEMLQIHAWGMPDDDHSMLHTAFRTDLPVYDEMMKKCEEIQKRYRFHDETASD